MFNGAHVIQAMALDIENLFQPGTYKFRYRICGSTNYTLGFNGEPRVIFSEEIGELEISTLKDAFIVLLIGCHEAAHVLNCHHRIGHTEFSDVIRDDRSLELFADFFGAKLLQTLVLKGEYIGHILSSFKSPPLNGNILYESIGSALGELYRTYYYRSDKSKIYESALSRVGICVNGINSVLDRAYGFDIFRALTVFFAFHKDSSFNDQPDRYLKDTDLPRHGAALMAAIERNGKMFHNMKPDSLRLLGGVSYKVNHSPRLEGTDIATPVKLALDLKARRDFSSSLTYNK